jgi:hypothetical protein
MLSFDDIRACHRTVTLYFVIGRRRHEEAHIDPRICWRVIPGDIK